MKNMTITIPDELREEMSELTEINWSDIARQAFLDTVEEMKYVRARKQRRKRSAQEAVDGDEEIDLDNDEERPTLSEMLDR